MTREENLHWLNEEIRTWENECQSKHPIKEALYAARKALEQEQKWIPCSEKLPEEMGTYLVTLDYEKHGTGITTLWFYGSLGWDLCVADAVTAWMPLPQPHKEEGEG